ncbi:hypothetical protein DXU02_11165 [Rhizobium leguminosarum]
MPGAGKCFCGHAGRGQERQRPVHPGHQLALLLRRVRFVGEPLPNQGPGRVDKESRSHPTAASIDVRWVKMAAVFVEAARMTFPLGQAIAGAEIMQERFGVFVVAVCTYLVGRFAILHSGLYPIRKNTRWKLLQLVTLLLTLPCFEPSQIFFKIAYSVNKRRLSGLRGQNFVLEIYNR